MNVTTLFTLLLTLAVGSFLNVCIYRIPLGESIATPKSHCPNCKTFLKWYDLIPVISFLSTKGKCRYCGLKISKRYPLVEMLNVVLYFLIFYRRGLDIQSVLLMFFSSVLIIITFIDIDYEIIPDSLNISILAIGIISFIVDNTYISLKSRLIGLVIGWGTFMIIAVVTNAMGGGDIKMMGALGFLFGHKEILLIMLLSFVFGAILSIILIMTGKKSRKDYIPFGPFIALAAMVSVLYGQKLLSIYLNMFLA